MSRLMLVNSALSVGVTARKEPFGQCERKMTREQRTTATMSMYATRV